MTRILLEVPPGAAFTDDEMSQERDARLLVAGAFPDKGLSITADDLDGIVARFSPDLVPVKVEHVDSPLDPLGLVKSVWRDGAALMGRLAFPPDLSGFLRRRGVARLSVGLERDRLPDGALALTLAEVSLVLRPRIPSAALLSEGTSPPTPLLAPAERLRQRGEQDATATAFERENRHLSLSGGEGGRGTRPGEVSEIIRLRRELRRQTVDGQVTALKAEGRLLPAGEPLARALLSTEESALVTFSEEQTPEAVADVFLRFLRSLPPLVRFGELAPNGDDAQETSPTLTPDQEAWLRRTLGVDPARVAETLTADQTRTQEN